MGSINAPYLILPSIKDHDTSTSRSILSLSDKKLYEYENMFEGLDDAWCVGSSHGLLVVLDKNTEPLLLNPSSGVRTALPSFPSKFTDPVRKSYFVEELRKNFIAKAVLLRECDSDPFTHISKFLVFMIYGSEYKIAFYKSGDETWTQLVDAKQVYCDVITSNNRLYALSNKGYVEGWDFNQSQPNKFLDTRPSGQIDEEKIKNFPRDKFSTQFYLVESMGDLLLVKRFIGNFVNQDGVAIDEADLLSSEDTHPLVCPYRTKHFSVYKLNSSETKWEKIKSLKDQVLFVGPNESTSLSAQAFPQCEANSIYFTDDNWDEMNLDYLYGGHDLGVFSVEEEIVNPLMPNNMDKIDPTPIWIVPIP